MRMRGRALLGPKCQQLEEVRREAAPRTRQRTGGAMEPAPDLGLGDSSLHRYLDCEFWSLKNEVRWLLGGCPLFRHRYRPRCHPAPCVPPPAASPRSPRVPAGSALLVRPGRGRAGGVGAVPEKQVPPVLADDGLPSPALWAQQRWRLHLPPEVSSARRAPSCTGSRGARVGPHSGGRGARPRVVAGRIGLASKLVS